MQEFCSYGSVGKRGGNEPLYPEFLKLNTMSESKPLILVAGATGRFAGPVVPELEKRGATVRALLRDESKAARVRKRGASQIVTGNLLVSAEFNSYYLDFVKLH